MENKIESVNDLGQERISALESMTPEQRFELFKKRQVDNNSRGLKLYYSLPEGFYGFWARNDTGDIERCLEMGYNYVIEGGKKVSRRGGVNQHGHEYHLYLMTVPEQWRNELQALRGKQKQAEARLAQIESGQYNSDDAILTEGSVTIKGLK